MQDWESSSVWQWRSWHRCSLHHYSYQLCLSLDTLGSYIVCSPLLILPENLMKTISMRLQSSSPGKHIFLGFWLVFYFIGAFWVLAEPHFNDCNQALRCFIWFWVWRSFWDAWREEKPAHSQAVDLVPRSASVPYGRNTTLGKQCRFCRSDLTHTKGLAV